MASRPQGWDYSNVEHSRPKERAYQTNNATQGSHGHSIIPGTGPSRASTAMAPPPDNDNRRFEPRQRSTRGVSFSNSSDASMSSTKASTGSSNPSSTSSSARTYDHNAPFPVRSTRSTAPVSVRPSVGLDGQFRPPPMPHSTGHDTERYGAPAAVASQPNLFANPHGIRETSAQPATSSSRARPVSMVATPTFANNFSGLGATGYGEVPSRQHQMPGAFPGDIAVPYRRPTDLSTQLSLSNESTEHFSSNSDIWDSEGDSGSNLSTSTNATTVASDITVGKDDTYMMTPVHGASTSSGATTPTQTHYEEAGSHALQAGRGSHAPILRRSGLKSVLSSSSNKAPLSSSLKSNSTTTQKSTKTHFSGSGSGSGSLSTRRSSQSGGPSIHIEVHKPTVPRESQSESRIQQRIEKVLRDHLELVEQRKVESKEITSASAPAPATAKAPVVRFAEPEQPKRHAPSLSAPEKATTLSKELVLQGKEIHKLELEVEKRDLIIKERERADVERKIQDDRAQAEREKQRERERQSLEIEKRDLLNAQKAEQQEREKERQQHERDRKETEKAQKAKEKERAKERQLIEKEKKEIEEEKARIEKAKHEHDLLHVSFMDQGRILSDLKARFDEQAKTLQSTEAERKELKRDKEEFEQKCSDLSKSLSHVSDKERYVVEQVASLQIIKESLQKRVGPLEERATRLSTENSELHVERDGLMKDLKTYLLRTTELEKETKGLLEEKRSFIAQVGELEKVKSELKAEVKALQEQITSLEGNLEARANDYSEHIAVLRNEHKSQLEGLEAQVAEIKAQHKVQIDDLEDQVVGLHEHIDGAHEDLKGLKSMLADEKTKFEALTAEHDKLTIDLEGQRIYAVEQEVHIMTLRGDLASRSDAIAKLQETNKTLQAEHEELQKLADEIDGDQTPHTSEIAALRTQNEQLSSAKSALEAKTAELEKEVTSAKTDLEAQVAATKTDVEARIAQLEASHNATRSALAAELASKSTLEDSASKLPNLEAEAAKVPALLDEKAALETKMAELETKTAELESKNGELESKSAELQAKASDLEAQASQLPSLQSECAKLAEQLAAANKLIEGLTAVQQAAQNVNTPASPAMTPLSPTFPAPPGSVCGSDSPKLAPQSEKGSSKVRSRAPSMVRSVSSRASSKRSNTSKDDMVMVRNPADRGAVQIVRKCDLRDLRTPRSRSQPPEKE
ncbi:hypothetical protein N0V93_004552 [Gnomoniopsis smithogilvyi]|uniref:Uncharacterized protein n=1 Tax=Gnomoniopsis smithogilvyi TaxID=1191159 RepID=A0A9W8YT27_9PEZI|nr:hypothetical protein N0V93_004552 [Gnomoniopsis smithogilvyi]